MTWLRLLLCWMVLVAPVAALQVGELPHELASEITLAVTSKDNQQTVGSAAIGTTANGLTLHTDPIIVWVDLSTITSAASYRTLLCTLELNDTARDCLTEISTKPNLESGCAFPQAVRLINGEDRGLSLLGYFPATITAGPDSADLTAYVRCETNNAKSTTVTGVPLLWSTKAQNNYTQLETITRAWQGSQEAPTGSGYTAINSSQLAGTLTSPAGGMKAAVHAVASVWHGSGLSSTYTLAVTATGRAGGATLTPLTNQERIVGDDIGNVSVIGHFEFPACTGDQCVYDIELAHNGTVTSAAVVKSAVMVVQALTAQDGTVYPSDGAFLTTPLVPLSGTLDSGTLTAVASVNNPVIVGGSATLAPSGGSAIRDWRLSSQIDSVQVGLDFFGDMETGASTTLNSGALLRMKENVTTTPLTWSFLGELGTGGAVNASHRSGLAWNLVPPTPPPSTPTPIAPTATFTPSVTPTPVETSTPAITSTVTQTATVTSTSTRTFTSTRTSTPTNTGTATATFTVTPTRHPCTYTDVQGGTEWEGQCRQRQIDGTLMFQEHTTEMSAHRGEIVESPIRWISSGSDGLRYETDPAVNEARFGLTMVTDLEDRLVNIDQNPDYIQVPSESSMRTAGACTQSHPCRLYPLTFTCGRRSTGDGVPLDDERYYCSLFGGAPTTSRDNTISSRRVPCDVASVAVTVLDMNENRGATAWLPTGCELPFGLDINGVGYPLTAVEEGVNGEIIFAPSTTVAWDVNDNVTFYWQSSGCTSCSGCERILWVELACIDD